MGARMFLAAVLIWTAALPALTPTRSQHAWVAGTGEPGDNDGAFMAARFNRPTGMLFDASADRLIVADTGNRRLRWVDLGNRNATATFHFTESGTGAAFAWLEPTALAWKQDGRLLYCLDRKKPGVAVVDLAGHTASWLPLPLTFSSKTGEKHALGEMQALGSVPGAFAMVSLATPTTLLLLDLPGGGAYPCTLTGPPGGNIVDLASDRDGLWALTREGDALYKLAPAGAGPGWMAAFAQAVTSTATCPDLLADTTAGQGLVRPWSLVRTSRGLGVACDAPAVMAYRDGTGKFQAWAMLDQHGRKVGLENDAIFDDDLKVLKTRASGMMMMGPKRLFAKPGYVCADVDDDRWYLSEAGSNRIVSLTPSRPDDPSMQMLNAEGLNEIEFPPRKKEGVHRVAMFGTCYFMSAKDTMRKADTFTKRLQWYLNVLSSMGDGPAYETMFFGRSVPAESSLTEDMKIRFPQAVGKYQADEVMIPMRPRDLATIVRGYQTFPVAADGLPGVKFDPEWVTTPRTWADISGSPLYLDLLKYVVAHRTEIKSLQVVKEPLLNVLDDEGNWPAILTHDYQNPAFLKKMFALYAHDFGVLKSEMEAQAAAESRTVSVCIVLFPEHAGLGPQEVLDPDTEMGALDLVRASFKGMCRDLGIRYIDLVDEMRLFSLDAPLVEVMDGHPTLNGADLMGLVTARRYLEKDVGRLH